MPSPKSVTYNNFEGGDWGDLGEFRAPAGTFSGLNVVLYDNGLLGPRAGLHENTYTGTMQGTVHGIWLVGRIGKPLLINAGVDLYATTEDNTSLGTVSVSASLDMEPTGSLVASWYDPNGQVYLTSSSDAVYALDWSTDSLTHITDGSSNLPGHATLYLCRDRLYLGGDSSNNLGHRVLYSAAADFTNFSEGNFFDVGYYNTVRSAVESQNSLMFSTLESTNNLGSGVGWYSLVGATPQGDLRRVNTQTAAGIQAEVVNAEDGNVYFWTGWTTADSDDPYLMVSNGAKFDDKTHFHRRLTGTNRYGYYNAPDQTLIYVSDEGSNGWMRCNGAWSKVHFEVPLNGPVSPTEAGNSFLLPYGAPGTAVKVYELLSNPSQPGVPSNNQNPGDAATAPIDAYFSLPAYLSDTKEVRVRRILVDFMKWDTSNFYNQNGFTVSLRTFGQYNLPAGSTDGEYTTTATFLEDETLASTTGTLDRYVMRCAQQGWAPGFQVSITGIKGCAIESITVEFDEADQGNGRTI